MRTLRHRAAGHTAQAGLAGSVGLPCTCAQLPPLLPGPQGVKGTVRTHAWGGGCWGLRWAWLRWVPQVGPGEIPSRTERAACEWLQKRAKGNLGRVGCQLGLKGVDRKRAGNWGEMRVVVRNIGQGAHLSLRVPGSFATKEVVRSDHWVCCCSAPKSCLTLQLHGLQPAKLSCPSPSPRVCSNPCPLSQ